MYYDCIEIRIIVNQQVPTAAKISWSLYCSAIILWLSLLSHFLFMYYYIHGLLFLSLCDLNQFLNHLSSFLIILLLGIRDLEILIWQLIDEKIWFYYLTTQYYKIIIASFDVSPEAVNHYFEFSCGKLFWLHILLCFL